MYKPTKDDFVIDLKGVNLFELLEKAIAETTGLKFEITSIVLRGHGHLEYVLHPNETTKIERLGNGKF